MDTIVVFIENEYKHADLVHSLNLLSIPYHQLYRDQLWVSHFDKLRIYVEGLQELPNEWVILSDSRDVLFYKGLDEINRIYQEHYAHADIVVQAEDTESGDVFFRKTKQTRYSFTNTHYKYPCSGLIMGRRTAIISFFQDIIENVPDNWKATDQPAIEWGMANLNHNVVLDSECRLFQQMGMGDYSGVNFHLHFNRNFIRNTHTRTEPCVFHGAGKAFLHPVWRIINHNY